MKLPSIAVTGALVLGAMPAAVIIGIIDAAFFGAEHGENTSRLLIGLMIGLIMGARHLAPKPAALNRDRSL